MTLETRNYVLTAVEVRAKKENDSAGRASGYAAVFNSDSHDLGGFIERLAPGAFTRSLSEAQAGTRNIYALWAHDTSIPLGSTASGKLILSEDERGLVFDLDVARFTPAQLSALEDGDLQMSFGFAVREQKWEETPDGGYIRTVSDLDLSEVSFVINPAYPETEAALRSLEAFKDEQIEANPEYRQDTTEMLKRVLAARLRAGR